MLPTLGFELAGNRVNRDAIRRHEGMCEDKAEGRASSKNEGENDNRAKVGNEMRIKPLYAA